MLRLLRTNRPLQRIGALGVAVLAVLCGGTAILLDRLHDETLAEATLGLRTLNASLAEQTARAIEGIDLTVGGVAEQIPLENRRSLEAFKRLRFERQVHEILKAKASSLPQMEALSLIAADGSLVNFTRQFPAPALDLSRRDYYLALTDADPGQPYLSRPTKSMVTGEWTLYIARRVNAPDGGLVGLVVGAIRLSYFEQFYRSLHVVPGSGFSLWWRDGMLLARFPPMPDKIGTLAAAPAIDRQIALSGTATLQRSIDGEDRILSVQLLRNYPLVVSVSRTRAEVLARWKSQAVVIAGAGLVSAVALALMLWAMARQFLAYETANRALGERRQAVEARDEAEEHVRQLQKMEALGHLTGGVAHDFNNLLQAVRSSLHMLEAGGELRGAESRRALEVASQAVDRGATLTQHLLAFARRQRLAPAPVDLGVQVAGMATLLEHTLGGAIRIRIDRDAAVPPAVPPALVDPHQFDIALLNLAINARDAMPDGGTLTIAVTSLSVGAGKDAETGAGDGISPALAPGGYVAVTVRDSGTGMPPDVLARACDPFFTTKPVGQGSGLGLSMVHGLTAQSGGGMRLESHPGLGTAVTLYLPHAPVPADGGSDAPDGTAAGNQPPSVPSAAPSAIQSAAVRVLLVEDDALVRMANAAVLDEAGILVSEASSGEEALALLEADEGIGVLVTDFAMPGMTGADLTRLVRRHRPGLPVLIVTGYAEKAVLQDLGREPGIRILSKPIPPAALIGHIMTAL